jgi:transposase InsO family protein
LIVGMAVSAAGGGMKWWAPAGAWSTSHPDASSYIRTWTGFIYAAFVVDAYSRMILGLAGRPLPAPTSRWTPSSR